AVHELGHMLGLAHPDQAGQKVDAIMNSHISSRYTLSVDDIAGAQSLYGAASSMSTPTPAPTPTPSATPTPTATATPTATRPPIPASPSNLNAAEVSSGGINLSWADNSMNESGFKIERSTDGTTFTQIATVASNTTTYASAGLNASHKYYYRVRAYHPA